MLLAFQELVGWCLFSRKQPQPLYYRTLRIPFLHKRRKIKDKFMKQLFKLIFSNRGEISAIATAHFLF